MESVMAARLMIFSSDCHGGLPVADYKPYLESRYHDDLDTYLAANEDGQVHPGPSLYDDIERRTFSGAVDAEIRLKALEREGMVGEVLFPDAIARNEVPFRGGMGLSDRAGWSLETQLAGQRAYNRWLADFCDPDRQVGLPLMNYADIEASARRCAGCCLGRQRKVRLGRDRPRGSLDGRRVLVAGASVVHRLAARSGARAAAWSRLHGVGHRSRPLDHVGGQE
jgi:hypothetical protein